MYYLSFCVCLGQLLTPASLHFPVWKIETIMPLHRVVLWIQRQFRQSTVPDTYFHSIIIHHDNVITHPIHGLLLYARHNVKPFTLISHLFPPTNLTEVLAIPAGIWGSMLRVVKRIVQCRTAIKWLGWDSNPCVTPMSTMILVEPRSHSLFHPPYKPIRWWVGPGEQYRLTTKLRVMRIPGKWGVW